MSIPPPATVHKILVVDDEPDLLEILDEWFSCLGFEVQTAGDGFSELALARVTQFDIVITDLKMPGLSGLHLLTMFKEINPLAEVIFLTGQGTMDDAIAALREGRAFDFLQKPLENLRQLNLVIEKALAKRQALALAGTGPQDAEALAPLPLHVEALSAREVEIVGLLARGLDNREIADKLSLSEKTVKNHLTRIYEKLKVKNRTQAVVFCQQYALI